MNPADELIAAMLANRYVDFPEDALAETADPGEWVGGWKDYVPSEVRDAWQHLNDEARLAVYVTANERFRRDERMDS